MHQDSTGTLEVKDVINEIVDQAIRDKAPSWKILWYAFIFSSAETQGLPGWEIQYLTDGEPGLLTGKVMISADSTCKTVSDDVRRQLAKLRMRVRYANSRSAARGRPSLFACGLK
ncbi:MAG TPA: hypothetical protein VFD58_07320 [Blastocatellia bacterium]|nr:hypothetical protein [Blastocatellia bacterium]